MNKLLKKCLYLALTTTVCGVSQSVNASCLDAQGNPLKETYLFYDDFGTFTTDSTYTYTDAAGKSQTVAVSNYMWGDKTKPVVDILPEGASVPNLQFSSNLSSGWSVSNVNPYSSSITGDASGTGKGGMLLFDVSNSGSVVYRHKVGSLKESQVNISVKVAALNTNPSGVATIELQLIDAASGNILVVSQSTLDGTEGWKEMSISSFVPDDSVYVEIVNASNSNSLTNGEFAIDDFYLSVCKEADSTTTDTTSTGDKEVADTASNCKYLFVDDFGTFTTDSTYTYTDAAGKSQTVAISTYMWGDKTKPVVDILPEGASVPNLQFSSNLSSGWAISDVNPYSPGVTGDMSGTGKGGMLLFDLSGSDNANKIIYRHKVGPVAKGKITISAGIGAINNAFGTEATVTMRFIDTKSKAVLLEMEETSISSTEGWKTMSATYTNSVKLDSAYIEIVNVTDTYGNAEGDFAIDNVSLQVCAEEDTTVTTTTDTTSTGDKEVADSASNCKYLFVDDFGTFTTDSTYTYTDAAGKSQTVAISTYMWGDKTKPVVDILPEGASVPNLQFSSNLSSGWSVSNVNPYSSSITGDASGTGKGGMLLFDVSNSGSVVYRHQVGSLKESQVNISVKVAALNTNPSGVATIELQLIDAASGKILAVSQSTLDGTEGWKEMSISSFVPDDSVYVEIVNASNSNSLTNGEFAIDNVSLQVCAEEDTTVTEVEEIVAPVAEVVSEEYFNFMGKRMPADARGFLIVKQTLSDGQVRFVKILK